MLRYRPLLGGVPWVGSPASRLLLRYCDASRPCSALLAALLGSSGSRRGRRGLPGSWATLSIHALDKDPGGSVTSGPRAGSPVLRDHRSCLPSLQRRRPHDDTLSGLNPTAYMNRCLRFVATVPPYAHGDARLASGRRSSALPGRELNPRIATRGFQLLHRFLLSQAWPGAMEPGTRARDSGASGDHGQTASMRPHANRRLAVCSETIRLAAPESRSRAPDSRRSRRHGRDRRVALPASSQRIDPHPLP